MTHRRFHNPQARPTAKPLNRQRLNELALAYVARFSTTAAKLGAYLKRKLRERGWDGEQDPEVGALVEKMVGAGYVDDPAYARARSGSLLRRGYGVRRIAQDLGSVGIGPELRQALQAGEGEQRRAALALARRRRLGPFGAPPADRAARDKQVATLLRAGHPLDIARQLLDQASEAAAEQWADEPAADHEEALP